MEWSLNEPNIEITHYIISKNRFEENSSKLNKILNGNVLNNRFKKIIMKFEEKEISQTVGIMLHYRENILSQNLI